MRTCTCTCTCTMRAAFKLIRCEDTADFKRASLLRRARNVFKHLRIGGDFSRLAELQAVVFQVHVALCDDLSLHRLQIFLVLMACVNLLMVWASNNKLKRTFSSSGVIFMLPLSFDSSELSFDLSVDAGASSGFFSCNQ